MKIVENTRFATCSTDIRDINNKEMRQMHELKERIAQVLNSHKDDSKKKEYINDEELTFMHAILSVFTKEYSGTQTSAFDDFLKEQTKREEKPVEPAVDED